MAVVRPALPLKREVGRCRVLVVACAADEDEHAAARPPDRSGPGRSARRPARPDVIDREPSASRHRTGARSTTTQEWTSSAALREDGRCHRSVPGSAHGQPTVRADGQRPGQRRPGSTDSRGSAGHRNRARHRHSDPVAVQAAIRQAGFDATVLPNGTPADVTTTPRRHDATTPRRHDATTPRRHDATTEDDRRPDPRSAHPVSGCPLQRGQRPDRCDASAATADHAAGTLGVGSTGITRFRP
jgi:hypothetical protein